MGAGSVWRGRDDQLLDGLAAHLSARLLRCGADALPVLDGGFDAVFDTTADGAALSLRLVRAGGTLITASDATAGVVDWPVVVRREITVQGRAVHAVGPDGRPALAAVRDWLADPAFPADGLVTHRFPVDQYPEAISVATASPENGACRVVFVGPAATIASATAEDHVVDSSPDLTMGLLGRLRGLPARAGSR